MTYQQWFSFFSYTTNKQISRVSIQKRQLLGFCRIQKNGTLNLCHMIGLGKSQGVFDFRCLREKNIDVDVITIKLEVRS